MPKIDKAHAPVTTGTRYPEPFAGPCRARRALRLGDAAGLTQFGVNELTLEPGTWSSQRHWHSHEDEFVYVLAGEVVLVTSAGETTLVAGDSAGFPANDGDGHCLRNRSDRPAILLVVGSRVREDAAVYPDIDLALGPGRYDGRVLFTRKDGSPY